MTELLENMDGKQGDTFLTHTGGEDELNKEEDLMAAAREDY